jgi:hypothetical protein
MSCQNQIAPANQQFLRTGTHARTIGLRVPIQFGLLPPREGMVADCNHRGIDWPLPINSWQSRDKQFKLRLANPQLSAISVTSTVPGRVQSQQFQPSQLSATHQP